MSEVPRLEQRLRCMIFRRTFAERLREARPVRRPSSVGRTRVCFSLSVCIRTCMCMRVCVLSLSLCISVCTKQGVMLGRL
jgi:hypothetical protein